MAEAVPNNSVSRREFNHLVLAGISLLGTASILGTWWFGENYLKSWSPNKDGDTTDGRLPNPTVRIENALETINEIRIATGVNIPTRPGIYPDYNGDFNIIPNVAELNLIKRCLEELPDPGKYIRLILPYRKVISDERIMSGEVRRLDATGSKMFLYLPPEGVSLETSNAIPGRDFNTIPQFVYTTMSVGIEGGYVKINNIPEKDNLDKKAESYEGAITRTIFHEAYHALEDGVAIIYYGEDIEKYRKGREAHHVINWALADSNHPLSWKWAEINGWKMFPILSVGEQFYNNFIDKMAGLGLKNDYYIWERDPSIWGLGRDRKTRVSMNFSYGPINENMADGYAAFKLRPDLLTPDERAFFEQIEVQIKDRGYTNWAKDLAKKYKEPIPDKFFGTTEELLGYK